MPDSRSIGRVAAVMVAAVLLPGCVSPGFRDAVGQFATITKATVASEDARLAVVSTEEDERIHAALATNRTDLRLQPDCVLQALAGGPVAPCHLVALGGGAIDETPRFAHIRGLGAALSDYSDNLIALAADSSGDRAAFAASVGQLGIALGDLDGAVRSATGGTPPASHAALDAIATAIGKAGGLILAVERGRALKRIVLAGDPIVQQAATLLSGADDRLGLYDRSAMLLKLQQAQKTATALVLRGATPQELRPAQDALFAALDQYNQIGTNQASYAAIGAAHAKLAIAARANATPAQLHDAILAVLDLAAATKALARTVSPKEPAP